MSTDNSTVHDAIAEGLGVLPPSRRRRDAIAAGWRRDDLGDRMAALAKSDQEEFDRIYGARGRIVLGMYEAGERAAAGDPDEAA